MYKVFAAKYESTVHKIRRKYNLNGRFVIMYSSKTVLRLSLSIMVDLEEKISLLKIKIKINSLYMGDTLYLKV
ncbi:hypothetical protein KTC92_07400 [Clostridium sp. CM027]|uniref:hypothetical protein n=1 Tax=Clostridium sp. CM027 TaxID=2849865 RepID=UPI001C6EE817|nr:hypothetical protein [Clostridium sp. CM027]MBW9146571.1 hypothetical protein [Clostridium sp. CM027]UVE42255.1 hypothetical protein KTC92_07400 [Clostridium sp. CM027]